MFTLLLLSCIIFPVQKAKCNAIFLATNAEYSKFKKYFCNKSSISVGVAPRLQVILSSRLATKHPARSAAFLGILQL